MPPCVILKQAWKSLSNYDHAKKWQIAKITKLPKIDGNCLNFKNCQNAKIAQITKVDKID